MNNCDKCKTRLIGWRKINLPICGGPTWAADSCGQDSAAHLLLQDKGHWFKDSNANVLAGEDRWFKRGVRESIFLRLQQPTWSIHSPRCQQSSQPRTCSDSTDPYHVVAMDLWLTDDPEQKLLMKLTPQWYWWQTNFHRKSQSSDWDLDEWEHSWLQTKKRWTGSDQWQDEYFIYKNIFIFSISYGNSLFAMCLAVISISFIGFLHAPPPV